MLVLYLNLIDNETQKRQFEEVYYTYRKQMGFLAKSILNNQQDAEDVVHDVFCSVASSHIDIITKAENEEDIRNYLLKSVKNASLSLLRKRKVRSEYEGSKIKEKSGLSDNSFIDKVCASIEFENFLELLDKLDKKYREVLYYHLVLDLSIKETAEMVGRPSNTVRQQIARGKNIIAGLLAVEGERTECQ